MMAANITQRKHQKRNFIRGRLYALSILRRFWQRYVKILKGNLRKDSDPDLYKSDDYVRKRDVEDKRGFRVFSTSTSPTPHPSAPPFPTHHTNHETYRQIGKTMQTVMEEVCVSVVRKWGPGKSYR